MSECKHEWSKGKMFYGKSDCPYCEIDRLKEELKVVRFDNNILRDQRSAEAQVEHKRYEEWRDTLPADTAMPVASWHILKSTWMKSFLPAIKRAEDLERQLAEARAENESLFLENRKMLQGMKWDNQLKSEARQEAARECLLLFYLALDESISFEETYIKGVKSIKAKFGLEG